MHIGASRLVQGPTLAPLRRRPTGFGAQTGFSLSRKMSHLSGQPLWLEDIAVDTFAHPSFGTMLNVAHRSRSQLAHDILDFMAAQLPGRPIRSLADGGYATKDSVRRLPETAHVVGRFPISGKLYEVSPPHLPKRRGAPCKKGDLIGSPKPLEQTATGWSPHPRRSGRRDPSLGGPVVRRLAEAPRAGRRAATSRHICPQTAWPQPLQPLKPFSPPISP